MDKRYLLSALIAATLAFSLVVPAINASTISVTLNPAGNEAVVDAYVNSSLSISASKSSPIIYYTLLAILQDSKERNITINATAVSNSSFAFSALNYSIASKDQGTYLKSLDLAYSRVVNNATTANAITIYANSSLKISMVVSNIFHNNSANLTWRNFTTDSPISLQGSEVNYVNLSAANVAQNSNVSTINMTAFSKSLVQWNRTYDSATNTTVFSMNAGNIIDVEYGNSTTLFNLTYTIDPSYSIAAPGFDSASADSITLGNPPTTGSPVYYFAIAAILVGGVLVTFYASRRGRR